MKINVDLTDKQYADFCRDASWMVSRMKDGVLVSLTKDADGSYIWVSPGDARGFLSFSSKEEADAVWNSLSDVMKGVQ